MARSRYFLNLMLAATLAVFAFTVPPATADTFSIFTPDELAEAVDRPGVNIYTAAIVDQGDLVDDIKVMAAPFSDALMAPDLTTEPEQKRTAILTNADAARGLGETGTKGHNHQPAWHSRL